ncbi:MAG: ETX/MTX2 family pore-forming toxin [Anaerolineae bacterium]|nr:ETX/MTX2 family pore-forming toxin [Anaerolineae bacterium]
MNPVSDIEVQIVPKEPTTKATPSSPKEPAPGGTKEEATESTYKMPLGGGDGGNYFEYLLFDDEAVRYRRVKKVEVTIEDKAAMRGICVTFDNGEQRPAGDMATYKSIFARADRFSMDLRVSENERITHTKIYTCPNTYLNSLGQLMVNGITIQTNRQEFVHIAGRPPFRLGPMRPPVENTTCGILIGIYGRAGGCVDQLGLILELPTDAEYIFEDFDYQFPDPKDINQKPFAIHTTTVENPTKVTIEERIGVSYEYSKTQSWTTSSELKLGAKATIKGGTPTVSEFGVELSAELSTKFEAGESRTEQVKKDWDVIIHVPPETNVQMTATIRQPEIKIPFTATKRTIKTDGSEVSERVSGVYEGVSAYDFHIKAVPLPLSD